MKLIKIYLAVVTVLLIIGLGFGVYAWYTIQTLSSKAGVPVDGVPRASIPEKVSSESPQNAESTTITEPVIIQTADLSESQKKLLEAFGFGGSTFTITPDMVRCAENAVGKVRLEEILGGSAPSPLESITLFSCFKG
jgi:hypothetical protein